jgi:hypothetical protein
LLTEQSGGPTGIVTYESWVGVFAVVDIVGVPRLLWACVGDVSTRQSKGSEAAFQGPESCSDHNIND